MRQFAISVLAAPFISKTSYNLSRVGHLTTPITLVSGSIRVTPFNCFKNPEMSENHAETTPSLVGYSVRSVQNHERFDSVSSLSSSRSPSKSNQKQGITHHDDYTSVNELVDEGALIHDEQAYDDLLDDSGKLRPAVVHSHTSIPGAEEDNDENEPTEVPLIKLAAEKLTKPSARSKELKLEDLEPEVEEDEPISSGAPSIAPSTDDARPRQPSIYELKNTDGANNMSLEDLIDSQIASMSELSSDFQKRISDKKSKPKVLESSRSRSRRRSNSGVIPDSVIENDSLQQVPAGAREGVYSPLVQSRSQSAIRTAIRRSKTGSDKPHLARGDSYKGAHSEYRAGRTLMRQDEDDPISHLTQASKEYLRSVSRSRSRAPTEAPISTRGLSEEGALISDPEHTLDMDVARDDAIDHLHNDVLQEESDEDDDKHGSHKAVYDETKTVKEISEGPKEKVATEVGTDVEIPTSVPNLADFEDEETTNPEMASKEVKKTENEFPKVEHAVENEVISEKETPEKAEVEDETNDETPLNVTEEVSTSESTSESTPEAKPESKTTYEISNKETVDTETGQSVNIPETEETEPEAVEPKETSEESKQILKKYSTIEKEISKTPADDAERLINELDAAIGGADDSVTDEALKEVSTEEPKAPTKDESDTKVAQFTGDLSHIASRDLGNSQVNLIETESKPNEEPTETAVEEPTETTKSTLAEEESEEIHEPTKTEIIEMLKDEPVYLFTSLAGGGFHMPTRTNKLVTILTGNKIPFTYRDLGTDEEARNVWRRYGHGRSLPAIVRGKDDIIGNWEEIEEANEDYRVRELIYETL